MPGAARRGAGRLGRVADRFHVVQNLQAAIKEQYEGLSGLLPNVRPILSEDPIAKALRHNTAAPAWHTRQFRQETIRDGYMALRQQGLTYTRDCQADWI